MSKRKAAIKSAKRTKRQLKHMRSSSETATISQPRDKAYNKAAEAQKNSSDANNGHHGKGSGYHYRRTFDGSKG
jgi:hypothetical protein